MNIKELNEINKQHIRNFERYMSNVDSLEKLTKGQLIDLVINAEERLNELRIEFVEAETKEVA
jgi:uncharacterized protein YjiS (DUF1127 family)